VLRRLKMLLVHKLRTREAFCDLSEFKNVKSNGPILNIHRLSKGNVGDIESSPVFYFFPEARRDDIRGYKQKNIPRDANLILGGGGLFRGGWHAHAEWLVENTRRAVVWGAGTNETDSDLTIAYPKCMKKFKLVGVRDYGQGFEWVPCASCMSKSFDTVPRAPKHEVVLYEYKRVPIPLGDLPRLTNYSANLPTVLEFLASGETVITSSYHGMYWSLLLGRKVLIYRPTSSKFRTSKYPVPVCDESNWRELVRKQKPYPEALEECREANLKFARRVRDLFCS
jgi:hypothetical protein